MSKMKFNLPLDHVLAAGKQIIIFHAIACTNSGYKTIRLFTDHHQSQPYQIASRIIHSNE